MVVRTSLRGESSSGRSNTASTTSCWVTSTSLEEGEGGGGREEEVGAVEGREEVVGEGREEEVEGGGQGEGGRRWWGGRRWGGRENGRRDKRCRTRLSHWWTKKTPLLLYIDLQQLTISVALE